MSEVTIRLRFDQHPCTNHTDGDYSMRDEDCENCSACQCESPGFCCREDRHSSYCPDCGSEVERPYCYVCNGESCGHCDENGQTFEAGLDVTYTGTVRARWVNGVLVEYTGAGHPHLSGSYCLGEAANLFENVTTKEQAIEAIVTHISNVDFEDGLGGEYHGIGAA